MLTIELHSIDKIFPSLTFWKQDLAFFSADAAAVSLTQMTFLATAMNIFSVVANISNNLNNNNNNNNKVSFNVQSNNNVVTNTNVNNGNQVNVMVPIIVLPWNLC